MNDKTAEQYRNEATDYRRHEQESFDRCDTDGCVTQFCDRLQSNLASAKARLVDQGKKDTFTGLYEGDRRVMAKVIETRYGMTWLLHDDEAERFGRRFIPIGGNSRIQKQLGLCERSELAPAWATSKGAPNARGLSGLHTVRTVVFRTGCKWGTDAELIEE